MTRKNPDKQFYKLLKHNGLTSYDVYFSYSSENGSGSDIRKEFVAASKEQAGELVKKSIEHDGYKNVIISKVKKHKA